MEEDPRGPMFIVGKEIKGSKMANPQIEVDIKVGHHARRILDMKAKSGRRKRALRDLNRAYGELNQYAMRKAFECDAERLRFREFLTRDASEINRQLKVNLFCGYVLGVITMGLIAWWLF
jgi:hypothetical protein